MLLETLNELETAADTLQKSSRGRDTLRAVLEWLNRGGIGLDGLNQGAILLLLRHAFRNPTTVRDIMEQALCKNLDKSKEI